MIVADSFYRYIHDYFKPIQSLIGVPFMIGGGCLGDLVAFGHVIKDYDIFFKTIDDMLVFEKRITEIGYKLVSETVFGRQYEMANMRLDIITWQVKTPEEFISAFDFTVNSMILDGDTLYHVESAIEDCVYKRLKPIRKLNEQFNYRVKRYMEKGYRIEIDESLIEISLSRPAISDVPPMNVTKVDLKKFIQDKPDDLSEEEVKKSMNESEHFKSNSIEVKSLVITKKSNSEYSGSLETIEPNGSFTYNVEIVRYGRNFNWKII